MDIKVIGTGCEKCGKLYENVLKALQELGIEEKVDRVDDLLEIVKLGVMTAPSLMVDGKLVVSGRIAKVDEIKRFLK